VTSAFPQAQRPNQLARRRAGPARATGRISHRARGRPVSARPCAPWCGQAHLRPAASELCLGGLIKHVVNTEVQWSRFTVEGMSAMAVNGKHFAGCTLLHIVAETPQHAGHADILRETIDGAKTMG